MHCLNVLKTCLCAVIKCCSSLPRGLIGGACVFCFGKLI
uniref:Uncharacterized protein n=1 Tax=Anguilla anguilla TaxID=7936 RepID=A0A0E9Y0L2_ANGAN